MECTLSPLATLIRHDHTEINRKPDILGLVLLEILRHGVYEEGIECMHLNNFRARLNWYDITCTTDQLEKGLATLLGVELIRQEDAMFYFVVHD